MQRSVLLAAILTISIWALGQDVNSAQNQAGNVPSPVATPQNENSTPVISGQTPTVDRLTTPPTITYANTAPAPAGATNATPGNRSGAVTATLNPDASELVGTPVASGVSIMDFGPSGSSSAWSGSGQSLTQAAAQARVHMAKDHPRLYTNADIARLNQEQNGFGNQNAAPVTNQNTMPASDVQGNTMSNGAPAAQPQPVPPNQNQQPKHSPFAVKPAPSQPPQR
jgi:hypothetical protein